MLLFEIPIMLCLLCMLGRVTVFTGNKHDRQGAQQHCSDAVESVTAATAHTAAEHLMGHNLRERGQVTTWMAEPYNECSC